MFRTVKTTRRVKRSPSPPQSGMDSMSTFLTAESASAFLKPWLRLERGLRLQRFRAYAEEYPDITSEERDILYKALVKVNDAKQLNTKQQIQYEEGKIVGIRGLKLIRGETTTFKIEQPRSMKRKHKDDKEDKEDKEDEKIEDDAKE
jgi:hypothetical protein